MTKKGILCFVLIGLLFGVQAYAAQGELGAKLKNQEPVKVYLGDFPCKVTQSGVTSEAYKKFLQDALVQRKSLKFSPVNNPAESLIQITGSVKSYQYLERGPLKVTPSAGMTALDAVQTATCNYAEMEADYVVTNTKTGEVLWKDTLNVYLKKVMTPAESIPLIYDKITKSFIKNCFGKPK